MAFPDYNLSDTSDGTMSIVLLQQQIVDDPLITTDFDGITQTGDEFELGFIGSPSGAEEAQCDALVAAHSGLEPYKDGVVAALLKHRGRRLEEAVQAEYPAASGNLFSCSESSQADWSKLVSMQTLGLVGYPFTVYTFDERVGYDLTDAADLNGAVTAVSTAVLTERAVAQGYIDATLAAADEAAAGAAAAPYLAM
jgi:hypothetical protein